MDATTFGQFLDDNDKHAGNERPIVLLLDNVSCYWYEFFNRQRRTELSFTASFKMLHILYSP